MQNGGERRSCAIRNAEVAAVAGASPTATRRAMAVRMEIARVAEARIPSVAEAGALVVELP